MAAGVFLEERLDPRITQGCRSTVRFSRSKIYVQGGRLTQRFNWKSAKHALDLAYRARPKAEYDALLDFFYVVLANGYIGFRVKNWSDYTLTEKNSALTPITGGGWQLQRQHTIGAAKHLRDVKKPVAGTVVVLRTRGGTASAINTSIDYATGITAINGHAAGDTYSAIGEFDYPMTFESDEWVTNLQASTEDLWLSPGPIMLEELIL